MKRLVVLVILVLLAACGPAATTQPDTGIEGLVTIGPMCPVVIEGQECPDQPFQATLTVLDRDGRRVLRFETDAEGRFRELLPPGDYILRPESPGESRLPFAGEQEFSVAAGQFTRLVVNYDSGIR